MIDKKITWALILAIAIESAGIFMWAGGVAERLRDAETQMAEQAGTAVRLTRVEVKLELASAQLARIEAKLDRQ